MNKLSRGIDESGSSTRNLARILQESSLLTRIQVHIMVSGSNPGQWMGGWVKLGSLSPIKESWKSTARILVVCVRACPHYVWQPWAGCNWDVKRFNNQLFLWMAGGYQLWQTEILENATFLFFFLLESPAIRMSKLNSFNEPPLEWMTCWLNELMDTRTSEWMTEWMDRRDTLKVGRKERRFMTKWSTSVCREVSLSWDSWLIWMSLTRASMLPPGTLHHNITKESLKESGKEIRIVPECCQLSLERVWEFHWFQNSKES